MRLAEQLEIANTITTEIAAGALGDMDLAGSLALILMPSLGKSDFTEAAKAAIFELVDAEKGVKWLRADAKANFENLLEWVRVELAS